MREKLNKALVFTMNIFALNTHLQLLLVWSRVLFCSFCLILVYSPQCDTISRVLAAPCKVLRLNKKHRKLPTRQLDCKVAFSRTRTSTHLMLFPSETVLVQSHGGSAFWCPLHTLSREVPGCMPAEECQPAEEPPRISISPLGHLKWSNSRDKSEASSLLSADSSVIGALQILLEVLHVWPGMLSSPEVQLMVFCGGFTGCFYYLMTPANPSHKYTFVLLVQCFTLRALQWII